MKKWCYKICSSNSPTQLSLLVISRILAPPTSSQSMVVHWKLQIFKIVKEFRHPWQHKKNCCQVITDGEELKNR